LPYFKLARKKGSIRKGRKEGKSQKTLHPGRRHGFFERADKLAKKVVSMVRKRVDGISYKAQAGDSQKTAERKFVTQVLKNQTRKNAVRDAERNAV